MKIAVFPGTFDPVTKGHLNVIKKAAALFDEVYVAVMINAEKKSMFSPLERLEMIRLSIEGMENVKAETFDGFMTDYCRFRKASHIVRGVRNSQDFEYEKMLSAVYKQAAPEIETVCFIADETDYHITSTVAREFIKYGKDLKGLLPEKVIEYIKEK